MNRLFVSLLLAIALPSWALAAGPKDYQVTGPVLEVTDDRIVVEKGKEKWELGRTKDTRIKGDLKKGSRVTVRYMMTATEIEVKDAKGDAKSKTPEKKSQTKAR